MQQFRSTGMDGKLELRRGALRVVAGSLLDDFCCRSSFKNCKMNDPSKVNIGKERVMIWDIFFRTLPCTRKFVQNLFCVYCGITSLHLQVIDQRFCHWKATMKGPSAEQAVEWRSYLCQKLSLPEAMFRTQRLRRWWWPPRVGKRSWAKVS